MTEGARARARREITAEIKQEARRQLAASGPDALSLRAVAREMGLVSSALYRYFPSRDDLLTALIIDAYDDLGAAAEAALAATTRQQPATRWREVCRSARTWALAHPQEYALVYGSPVPGYSAPEDTVAPAARVGLALVEVARDAHERGVLSLPDARPPAPVQADADALLAALDAAGAGLPAAAVPGLAAAWAQLFGLISFELFGQFRRVVEARTEFFDLAVDRLAAQVGLASDREPG
jgi:AcrR family transcriptional regulator